MRSAPIAALVVMAVGALVWWAPWALDARDYPATIPQPLPLLRLATVPVGPGDTACWGPVVVDVHAQRALFRVGTGGAPGQPLRLSLSARGWTARRDVPGGYPDGATLAADFAAPAHDVAAQACARNLGRATVVLLASDDRTKAPYDTTVGSRRFGAVPEFAFYERGRHSIARRMPLSIARMGAFRPGLAAPWLLWPLALLVGAGVPLAVVWGLVRTFATR